MAKYKPHAAQSASFALFAFSIVAPVVKNALTVAVLGLTALSLASVLLLVVYDVNQYENGKTYTFSPLQHVGIATAALLLTIATPALSSFILPVMTLLAVVGYMMAETHLNQTFAEKCINILPDSMSPKRDWSQGLKNGVERTFDISLSPN